VAYGHRQQAQEILDSLEPATEEQNDDDQRAGTGP
jgi:hypothetical protein